MGVTSYDIKRAILGNGDVSAFTSALPAVLKNVPIPSLASQVAPVELPEATKLLEYVDKELMALLEMWIQGKGYSYPLTPNADITLLGLSPYGRNIGGYLEGILEEIRPDIVAADISPAGLSAHMLYTFGMSCAVGLPMYGELKVNNHREIHVVETFYPGNMIETTMAKCWLAKIPMIPVGMPLIPKRTSVRVVDDDSLNRELYKSNLQAAYHAFDERLEIMPNLQKGMEITNHICSTLITSVSGGGIEKLMEEASYIASRIIDATSYVGRLGRKAKLLALVDVKHFVNVQYVIGLLTKGIMDEVYLSVKRGIPSEDMSMVIRHSSELDEYAQEHSPKTSLTQEYFRSALERLSRFKAKENLLEDEVDNFISSITARTRNHPDIDRGASVRGAIAFREVLQGYKDLQKRFTRGAVEKAALITIPPRISTRSDDYESALAIVSNIVKEVLYGVQFSRPKMEIALPDKIDWLSPEDNVSDPQNVDSPPLTSEQKQELADKGEVTILPDDHSNPNELDYLETDGIPQKGGGDHHPSTSKDMRHSMSELDQKLSRGEITEDEYHQAKGKLEEMLANASGSRYPMSGKELSETVMDFMDAQDMQWPKEVSLEQMYIYYHVQSMSEGKQLTPPKRDYHGLKGLIGDLEERGILKPAGQGINFTLTTEALDTLLDNLIPRARRGKELKTILDAARAPTNEYRYDTRRYSIGDVFRDISVRHTLREVARQQKQLSDIARRDFRVFMKKYRRFQSDIVLCLDTSGSMRYDHKLLYTRLAAAGLARAALKNGDRVGIVTFDNFGKTILPLTDKKADIFDYIIMVGAGGNTNIGDGIKCANELLLREPTRNQRYTVLITDGQPTAVSEKVFDKLKLAKEKDITEEHAIIETRNAVSNGVKVSVIHITNTKESGEGFLRDIARVGKGQIQRIGCLEDLKMYP